MDKQRLDLRRKERKLSNERLHARAAREAVEDLTNLVKASRKGGSATVVEGQIV